MFERIDIGIKTFLRDSQLFNSIDGIQRNYPGARMIIADCGDLTEEKDSFYAQITREGHIVLDLPFDAGFGVMSNAIAAASTRPYLLIASDDFEFNENKIALCQISFFPLRLMKYIFILDPKQLSEKIQRALW